MSLRNKLFATSNDNTVILIRLMVGVVIFSEGIQKLLFPALRGVGRFEKIGLPNPEFSVTLLALLRY